MTTERISITIDTELLSALKKQAEKEHRNVSNLIAHLAAQGMEREGKMENLFYCTQNDGDCKTCSLSNYGKDCQNNPIHKIKTAEELDAEIGDHHGLFTLD